MTAISVSTTVAASPDEVWAELEVIERHSEWMADAERITFRTERHRGVGTEFACHTRVGPLRTVDVMTVVEWEPGRQMGVRHRGLVSGVGRFVLEPLPDGATRFSWHETLHFPARFGGAVAGLLAKPVLTWVWRRNLRRFRSLVSSSAP